jgi:decaprenyl-phosphate phosphoribosyltransferase
VGRRSVKVTSPSRGGAAAPSAVDTATSTKRGGRDRVTLLADLVATARPDHWFKNIFMLPGAALALVLANSPFPDAIGRLLLALASTCLIASANYTINEWLDAEFDRHHPTKNVRPSAAGRITAPIVYAQWAALATAGMSIAATISINFLVFSGMLLVMGLVYNVKPLRTKDRPYLDVLSESVNNVLRFLLGWSAIISDVLPPSSILLACWMGGAYLMAIKRYAEFRFINSSKQAGLYRRSFQLYTEESLLASAFFYALCSAFFLGVFLIKYRIEFLLSMPFLALLFTWYLVIGMRTQSLAQSPEKMYREKPFVLYVAALSCLIIVLFFVDLPWLNVLVENHVLRGR